jgi:hypothetical protein
LFLLKLGLKIKKMEFPLTTCHVGTEEGVETKLYSIFNLGAR